MRVGIILALVASASTALAAAPPAAPPRAPAMATPPVQSGFGNGLLPGERAYTVGEIPGVVAAGGRWSIALASFDTMDGLVGTPDGGVVFAQEQTDSIRKLEPDGRQTVFLQGTHHIGSMSIGADGRLYAVQRTCTDPGLNLGNNCLERTMISILAPERKMLANAFPDGKPLGRLNDIVADGRGGAFFTVDGIYHIDAEGRIATVARGDIRTNGVTLSRDGRTLYVTNNTDVQAWDVAPDGRTGARRTFGDLGGDTGGDGMAIDAEGRVYVTGNAGVHVFAPDGRRLGMIPTPRRPIALAFSGPGKKTLFVIQTGAVGPDGKPWTTPEGVRNNAKTLYTLPMLAAGFAGRPK
jgi:gluconolactonase